MGLSALLAVLQSLLLFARVWAATTHQVPWEPGSERVLKANRHLNSRVYEYYGQKGYQTCQHHPQLGWLHLHRRVNCTAAFQDVLAKVEMPPVASPPKDMPADMVNDFLVGNQAHLRLFYHGNTVYHGGVTPHDWSAAVFEQFMSRVRRGDSFDYGPEEASTLYRALDMYPVEELSGLVVGSITPWVESILLVAGARNLTTVEYNPINSGYDKVVAVTPSRFAERWLGGSYRSVDFAFTYSSIEHNGLGRYGDPLDPAGDLKDVETLSCVIKPGGLLYLGVPVGPDAVVFNVHRIYGLMRLPMLTANFKVLSVIGPGNLTLSDLLDLDIGAVRQPTIVLQNKRHTPCDL